MRHDGQASHESDSHLTGPSDPVLRSEGALRLETPSESRPVGLTRHGGRLAIANDVCAGGTNFADGFVS